MPDAQTQYKHKSNPPTLPPLTLRIGHEELVIRKRYEVVSIINDILIGIWFVIGSLFFFSEALTYYGTWLFFIGSIEMLIRPVIRLMRHIHIRRLREAPQLPPEAEHDF
ncbi:hypothetical protein EVC62_02560 [Salinicola endophyticus]|uniref:YrhK domain-containing protein n=1 Tax=Salinicola endophyticus TaxID=1949083 RepID=A0ABY8FCE7_9GAMM|nr:MULTISPECIES: YrhK family protein [Salinicola]WFF40472.1 hypothetical protein EVC62_02560 [Salinicola endophyticus]